MALRPGQKVIVSTFPATVQKFHSDTATWHVHVTDDNGNSHYLWDTQLTPVLPYVDGQEYIDSDGDQLIFQSAGYYGGPGWRSGGSTHVYGLSSAKRPLRLVGPEIEE